MKTAFLFPGQGAQYTGMGQDTARTYPVAEALFARANDIVGYDLRKLCFEGPEEELGSTVNSQPAIFVTTAAILEVLRTGCKDRCSPFVCAGLSLGEYSALYAAGLISFDDGVKLVHKRGQAMQAAADATEGTMVSVLGLDEDKVRTLCEEAAQGELLTGANYNCPGQIVISGTRSACRRAADLAEKYGAIKAVELKVAGAFHTEMMMPASRDLGQALAQCDIQDPANIKVISNIDTTYYANTDQIRTGLSRQLVAPLLWQKCMEKLIAEGIEAFYEIGPGRVLTGLMKRINRKIKVVNISDAQSLNDFISQDCVK